jgi:DNA primase
MTDEFIEEVRVRNDIVDVIGSYLKLTRRGSNYFGLCPFHGEKTASFSVSQNKQMFYCFGCGAGGNVFTFIMNYENFTFPEAVEYLAKRVSMELPKREYSAEEKRRADRKTALMEINKDAANYYYLQRRGEAGKIAQDYFEKRKLSPEMLRQFALGFSLPYRDDLYQYLKKKGYSDALLKDSGLVQFDEKYGGHDKFWNRVMFPIQDVNGHVIGFGGRVLGDGSPKYMNSPETEIFDKSRNLYGLNFARKTRKPYMILCEGYMDVISMHQAGFSNAVASLGTSLTQGHAKLISRYCKEVLLCYDSDGAGVRAALRAIPILKSAGISARVINMRPYKDPDEFIKELGAEEFQKRLDGAQNSFLFEISVLEQDYDLNDPDAKTRFFRETAKRLTEFTEELERNNYIETLAGQYQIDKDALRKLVNQYGLEGMGRISRPSLPEEEKRRSEEKEDGIYKSQRLLLTWILEEPEQFPFVKSYIMPEDFSGELYQKVAEHLYRQLEEKKVNPAAIISSFPDEREQKQIAAMFNVQLLEGMKPEERDKALKETIRKMKQRSIERNARDPAKISQVIADKKALQNLNRLRKG